MSDNNSPSKDFSQGPSSYGKTSVIVNGIPSQEGGEGSTPSPSVLFSSRPFATPGSFTFGVKNKAGKETIIENSWNRAPSVGAEISKGKEVETLRNEKEFEKRRENITVTIETLKDKIRTTFDSFDSPSMEDVKKRITVSKLEDEIEIFATEIKNLESYLAHAGGVLELQKIEDGITSLQKSLESLKKAQFSTMDEIIKERNNEVERLKEELAAINNTQQKDKDSDVLPHEEKKGVTEQHSASPERLEVGSTINLINNEAGQYETWSIVEIQDGYAELKNTVTGETKKLSTIGLEKFILDKERPINPSKVLRPETKEKTKGVIPNHPVGDIISVIKNNNQNTETLAADFTSWMNKWVTTGAIDKLRKRNGNIIISDAQITSTKKLLEAYKKILEKSALGYVKSTNTASLAGNISFLVKILSGVHDENLSDIQYLVENYNEAADAALLAKLEASLSDEEPKVEAVGPNNPNGGVPPKPPIDTAPNDGAGNEKAPRPLDVESVWPSYIYFKKDKNKSIWIFSKDPKNTVELMDTEGWSREEANGKPLFNSYLKFITEGTAKEKNKKRELYRDLIDIKNQYLATLNTQNLDAAEIKREEFRVRIDTAKDEWAKEQKKQEEKTALIEEFKTTKKNLEAVTSLLNYLTSSGFLSQDEIKRYKKEEGSIVEHVSETDKDIDALSVGTTKDIAKEKILYVKHELDIFLTKLKEIESVVTKEEAKQRGTASVMRSPFAPKSKDGQMIRLRKPILKDGVLKHEITVGEWRQNQETSAQESSSAKNEGSLRDFFSLKAMHEEMLARDPEEYIKTYVRKDWAEGDMGKRASEEAVANYVAKAKEEYDKALEEKLALDILISRNELPEGEHVPEGKQLQLTQTMERILKNLERIDKPSYEEKLRKFNDMLAKDRSLRSNREVYSPAQDESIAYMTVGGGAPSGWSEKAKFKRATKANEARIAGRKALMENGVGTYTATEALLSEKTTPNHYEGMAKSLLPKEAKDVENSYLVPEHALVYEDTETPVQKPVATQETFIPSRPDTPETLQEKMSRVKKLYETIDTYYKKKYGSNWKAWVVAIPLFVYGVTEVVTSIDVSKKPETLGQAMAEMSWQEEFVQSKEDKEFLKDFASTSELGFVGNMKKYAPSNILDENNLSTIKGISDLKCIDLFDASKPTVEGLTNAQRKELCGFVQRLERIMGYAQGKDRRDTTTFREHAYKDYSDEPTMTLQKYYDIVRRVVEEQNNKEAALRKNN